MLLFGRKAALGFLVCCQNLTVFPLRGPQPRSQGLSSLPLLVVGTETLGGRKICWKGGVFYRPLDQTYLSTHPPCGFG